MGNSPFFECFLILTEDCNLRCKYCYENDNRGRSYMPFETAKQSADFLIDNVIKHGAKELRWIFFGGEPLLNLDVMIRFYNYVMEIGIQYNIRMRFLTITNGTIYNNKIEKFFLEYCKSDNIINFSVDGIPEVQDENRITANGKPTSKVVIKNILKIKDLFERNQIDSSLFHTVSVITKSNISSLFLNHKYFKDLGVNALFALQYDEDWDEKDVTAYIEQLSYIADYEYEECIAAGSLEPYYKAYLINDLKPIGNIINTCAAGKTFCAIAPNGDIYPCHRAYFRDPDFKLGNVFDGIINNNNRKLYFDAYRSNMHMDDISCGKCDNTECKICMLLNYLERNDILKCNPVSCSIYKARWNFINDTKKKFYKLFNKNNYTRCNEITFLKSIN